LCLRPFTTSSSSLLYLSSDPAKSYLMRHE
jgi:hypothetical protein